MRSIPSILSTWFAFDLCRVEYKVTLGSSYNTKPTDPKVFSTTFAKKHRVMNRLRALLGQEAPGRTWRRSGCCRLFAEGELLARETRDTAQREEAGGEPLVPHHRRFRPRAPRQKTKSNQKPFLSAEKRGARPASLQAGVTAFTLIMALLRFRAPH